MDFVPPRMRIHAALYDFRRGNRGSAALPWGVGWPPLKESGWSSGHLGARGRLLFLEVTLAVI